MINLNNPEMISPFDPDAAWKREVIVYLGEWFGLRTLVETGSSEGDCIEHVRHYFDQVLSVELSKVVYEKTARRFTHAPNVLLFLGSSGEMLPLMIAETSGPLLFWLDAHVTGGLSADDGDQIPAELDAIVRLRPESLVLIDDTTPDLVQPPQGWKKIFLRGMTILHDGRYDIPERF